MITSDDLMLEVYRNFVKSFRGKLTVNDIGAIFITREFRKINSIKATEEAKNKIKDYIREVVNQVNSEVNNAINK